MKYFGKLPEYYLTKQEAKINGWRPAIGNLDEAAPGKMIGGDVYKNRNGHLPSAEGRVWLLTIQKDIAPDIGCYIQMMA